MVETRVDTTNVNRRVTAMNRIKDSAVQGLFLRLQRNESGGADGALNPELFKKRLSKPLRR